MKIKPSTAQNQCPVHDADCAPPIRCELEAGHEGEHQWSGTRNAPKLQEDGSYKDDGEEFTKTFTIEEKKIVVATPAIVELPGTEDRRAATAKRVTAALNTNNTNTQQS
jgi:hypothetical protein